MVMTLWLVFKEQVLEVIQAAKLNSLHQAPFRCRQKKWLQLIVLHSLDFQNLEQLRHISRVTKMRKWQPTSFSSQVLKMKRQLPKVLLLPLSRWRLKPLMPMQVKLKHSKIQQWTEVDLLNKMPKVENRIIIKIIVIMMEATPMMEMEMQELAVKEAHPSLENGKIDVNYF